MIFGDPVVYYCPHCKKPMKMTTYRSYTVHRSEIYSDGFSAGRPHFAPNLAKCPRCKKLFYRHRVKNKKEMDYRIASVFKNIETPDRADLMAALKEKIFKNKNEEKTLREDLWRKLNHTTRYGQGEFDNEELTLWKSNCAALLPLAEYYYKEMQLEKNAKKHNKENCDNCLIQIAELNRNIGNFDECMNLIDMLDKNWNWLKEQFRRECKKKNIFTFKLMFENELNIENDKKADKYDYSAEQDRIKPEQLYEKDQAASEETEAQSEGEQIMGFEDDNEEKENIIFDFWTEVPDWHYLRDSHTTSFVIHDNVIEIGKFAFAHCRKLKKVDIGSNVVTIGKYAFRKDNRPGEMANISEVINRNEKPQIIGKNHFLNNDLSKTVLRVPEQSIDAYKQAEGWKDFGTIIALDEVQYPKYVTPPHMERFAKIKKPKKKKLEPLTVHIWLGSFETENELEEYADNSEYEWEYYGHLLGEDNFDEPPEEYGIGCAFCSEVGIQYEEAADITDNLVWEFYGQEQPIQEIFTFLPVDPSEVFEACKEKYPGLKKANSCIAVFGWHSKKKNFKKAALSKPCYYIGEFELPEPDTDGQYEGMD